MTKNTLLLMMTAAAAAFGHHGYAEYDRTARVSLEGIVQSVMWGNPHVLISLQTADRGSYRVEWGSVFQLSQTGIHGIPIKAGDRLIVTGSVNRNPEKHILTLVRAVSRPADGWHGTDPRYPGSN